MGNRYPPWSLGGYEAVWSTSVARLREHGHHVRVLTTRPDPSDRPAGAIPDAVHRELGWYWRSHRFPPLSPPAVVALERGNARVLRRHLAQFAPDAVVWWAMGGMSLSLLEQVRRAGVPAAGAVGDEWMVYGPRVDRWSASWRGAARPVAGVAERLVGVPARLHLDQAAHWAFNSRHLLDAVRADGWTLPGAEILPPGVDLRAFAASERGPWRWRLLYCGRLDPRKGIATAVEALPALPEEAVLRIHGDGEAGYRDELRRLAERLGVAGRVRFTSGPHEEVPTAYAAADAVLFPVTWREPWGLVPLEAMAVGRPVAASRSGGGAAEYLEDGRNCLQFDAGDPRGLVEALRRLAADAGLRRELVAGGRATAARYSADAFHDGLEARLERIVQG